MLLLPVFIIIIHEGPSCLFCRYTNSGVELLIWKDAAKTDFLKHIISTQESLFMNIWIILNELLILISLLHH